ncbi:MAG: zf-HC2 domain-containing protein [Pseudomonadota bacterium]
MTPCHEPISWLRLEHFHLGELPAEQHRLVAAHIAACPACRAQLAEIEDDSRTLPPLPLPAAPAPAPWWRRWSLLAPATLPLMVAALALILLIPPATPELPGPRVAFKGGELALALVRARGEQAAPSTYLDGDRFQVLLTLPPGGLAWDLVVLQAGEAFFPLEAGVCAGGNRVPVGAFTLTGPGDAVVCAVAGEGRPSRDALQAQGAAVLGEGAVCVGLGWGG